MTNKDILVKELELGRNIFCPDELIDISKEYDVDYSDIYKTLEDDAMEYGYEAMNILIDSFHCEKMLEKRLRVKYGKPVQVDVKVINEDIPMSPRVSQVLEKVLKVCGCSYQDLRSKTRKRERIKGVHLFWYICAEERLTSYQTMAEIMNRGTHSVALQMHRKFKDLLQVKDPICTDIYEKYKNL